MYVQIERKHTDFASAQIFLKFKQLNRFLKIKHLIIIRMQKKLLAWKIALGSWLVLQVTWGGVDEHGAGIGSEASHMDHPIGRTLFSYSWKCSRIDRQHTPGFGYNTVWYIAGSSLTQDSQLTDFRRKTEKKKFDKEHLFTWKKNKIMPGLVNRVGIKKNERKCTHLEWWTNLMINNNKHVRTKQGKYVHHWNQPEELWRTLQSSED